MATLFYWDEYNEIHIAEHGIVRRQAEWVVVHTPRRHHQLIGEGKTLVRGREQNGGYLQVIYVYRAVETVDLARLSPADRLKLGDAPEVVYVIHARPLNDRERRQQRRRRR